MEWRSEEILIIVKVYPVPSKKYGETVCTAGITKSGAWIRLYPIPYRNLPPDKKFAKFQWIRARVAPASEKLQRPESHKIDPDSIELLHTIPAQAGWSERERYFLPLTSPSLELIMQEQEKYKTSLGAFRPKEVKNFVIEKITDCWTPKQLGTLAQTSLLHTNKTTLEKIPYKFRYQFTCDNPHCTSHDMVILDWEAVESYRNFKRIYKDERTTLQKLKEKWLDYFFRERESYFVVGTDSEFGKFMILTVVSPRRKTDQMSLL